jgi:hypothetical protein
MPHAKPTLQFEGFFYPEVNELCARAVLAITN